MTKETNPTTLTRRALLGRAASAGSLAVIGGGFMAAPNASWALTVNVISSHQMATVFQMARDIYPHDQIGDEYYVIAVKGYDSDGAKDMIAEGVAALDTSAQAAGFADYLSVGWESDRVKLLTAMEETGFLQTIRGGLVTGLYNQKAVWPIFGYEGESFSQGGYIDRGFDDINWL